ncbi:MAG: hypothetical protein QOJ50_2940 [Cryptosporangiaceae bacterium]|nr:hypothetical protein [Cryptosporangiaceae bacterium]
MRSLLGTAIVAAVTASVLAATGGAAHADGLAAAQTTDLGGGSTVSTHASTYKSSLYATTTVHAGSGNDPLTACVVVRFLGTDGTELAETPAHAVTAEPGQPDPEETWYWVADWDAVQRSASLQIVQTRC